MFHAANREPRTGLPGEWTEDAALSTTTCPLQPGRYRIAIGLPGDPVAPFSFSGAKKNANS